MRRHRPSCGRRAAQPVTVNVIDDRVRAGQRIMRLKVARKIVAAMYGMKLSPSREDDEAEIIRTICEVLDEEGY